MEIEQFLWGATPEGEAALIYVLRGGGVEARVTNAGAAVVALTAPGAAGQPVGLLAMPETFDAFQNDYTDTGRTLLAGSYGFGRRMWESRVETNRVVMTLDEGAEGEPPMQLLFDMDDDGTFSITMLARGTGSSRPVALHQQLRWRKVAELRLADGSPLPSDGAAYPVADWQPNILGEAVAFRSAGAGVRILSSQPEATVRHDGDGTTIVACLDSHPRPLDEGALYCQKTAIRIR